MRVKEKVFRRIDKLAAARYNAKYRPRQVINLGGERPYVETSGPFPSASKLA
jgi:hypothetical protein